MKSKQKTIGSKELIKQVATLSGYYDYEIVDILNALSLVIAENAKKDNCTNIKGLGTFSPKKGYNIKGTSNITGEEYNTVTKNSLSFKVDKMMKNALNKGEESR